MTIPSGLTGIAAPPRDPGQQLRRMADELEAVFLNQLFQVMRASVPEGEAANPGEQMFTAMLDEKMASEAARRAQRGLGEAVFRQLSRRLPPADPPAPAPGNLP